MKVVATDRGYDNVTVREPGDQFDMPDNVFEKRAIVDDKGKPTGKFYPAPNWFKPVSKSDPEPAADTKGDGSELV